MSKLWSSLATCGWTCATGLPVRGPSLAFSTWWGDVRLSVSAGTRVTTTGTTLLGDQRVDVETGEGRELEVRAWGLFGDVKMSDKISN
jgi:hypothetical protein